MRTYWDRTLERRGQGDCIDIVNKKLYNEYDKTGYNKSGRLTIRSQPQMCGKVKIMQTIQKRYGKADVRRTPN